MNQRIKELAEQAGFVDKGNNLTAYTNFDHEKFAELVIQECADWIRINYNSPLAEPLAFSLERDFELHGDY